MQVKCDIYKERKALDTVNDILNRGGTVELFIGKTGLLVRQVTKKLKYESTQASGDTDKR